MFSSHLQVSGLYRGKSPIVPRSCQPWKVWKNWSLEAVVVFLASLLPIQFVFNGLAIGLRVNGPICRKGGLTIVSPPSKETFGFFSYFMLQVSLPRWRTKERRHPSCSLCHHWHYNPSWRLCTWEREYLAHSLQGWWGRKQSGRRSPDGQVWTKKTSEKWGREQTAKVWKHQ